MRVQHTKDSLDLVCVAIDNGGEFLGVVLKSEASVKFVLRRRLVGAYVGEPTVLPIVWALPAHLEVLPAALRPLLRRIGVVELVLLVVVFDQILDDGARLPEGDASVGVCEGRKAACNARD